jgi:hypothetical protein
MRKVCMHHLCKRFGIYVTYIYIVLLWLRKLVPWCVRMLRKQMVIDVLGFVSVFFYCVLNLFYNAFWMCLWGIKIVFWHIMRLPVLVSLAYLLRSFSFYTFVGIVGKSNIC